MLTTHLNNNSFPLPLTRSCLSFTMTRRGDSLPAGLLIDVLYFPTITQAGSHLQESGFSGVWRKLQPGKDSSALVRWVRLEVNKRMAWLWSCRNSASKVDSHSRNIYIHFLKQFSLEGGPRIFLVLLWASDTRLGINIYLKIDIYIYFFGQT